jgi:hypothetical protein
VAEELSISATLTAAVGEEEVTPEPSCEVRTTDLALRTGPDLAFEPPVRVLGQGTQVIPVGRDREATWVEALVPVTGESGWVEAGGGNLSCNVDTASLALAVVPPTPVLSSPTPPVLVVVPVEGDGNWLSQILHPDYFPAATSSLNFRVRAYDGDVGTNDGDGIEYVDFYFYDAQGHLVYERREREAAYCAFGGNEPSCTTWIFAAHGNKWPSGEPIKPGLHRLEVEVRGIPRGHESALTRDGETEFQINLP